jgi:hypothetical protein
MSRYLNLSDRFGATVAGKPVFGRLPAEELNIPKEDIAVLRALGEKKHRYANDPVMDTRRKLWRATNDLAMIKPPIYINEICWEEMNGEGELDLQCTHPFAVELEDFLRKELYCYDHDLGDCIIEDMLESPLVVYDSGFGIDEDVDAIHTDRNSEIVSRHFKPYILTMDDIEKIKTPEIYLDMERTEQYTQLMREIFDGIIDVQIVGARGLWFTPWDYLIRVMGINETLYNLMDEPEFVEAAVKRYVDCAMVRMEKYKELGIWASNNAPCRVGSGGYGIISCLDEADKGDTNCDTLQMWGCGNAQIFSTVSPDMHWQFSLQYEMEWLKCFGVTYYGCCEPLYNKMDIMDRIPNLRKVSMSPWNKWAVAAERCRGKYVMSCKPSPAKFTVGEFSDAQARKELETIINETEGCSIEVIMKDISTVDYHPERLWRWAKIARETIDGMFD